MLIIVSMKQNKVILLVLIGLSILLYSNTINYGYVLDDFSVIKENNVVQKGFEGISTIWKTHYRHGYGYQNATLYRPLPLSLFAVQWELSPDNPRLGHICNVLLFTLLGIVIYLFLLKLLGKEKMLIAFLSTLLFIAHPIHTEVVANIKSVDDIMAMLFVFISLLLFLRTLEKPSLLTTLTSLLFFQLAFFSKESTVTFLVIIPVLLILLKQYTISGAIKKTLPFIIPFVIYMIARFNALGSLSGDQTIAKIDNLLLTAPNWIIKFATAIKIMGLYLWKLILPHPLMNDYSLNQIQLSSFTDIWVWLSIIAYSSLVFLFFKFIKNTPLISFSIAFYLIGMFLYSNLVFTIGTSFGERLLFIPSLGFCIVVAFLINSLFKNPDMLTLKSATKPLLLSAVIISIYSFKTIDRNKAWESNFSLYETDVANCPNSARCQYYYGLGLMKERGVIEKNKQKQRNYYLSAINAFNLAVQIYPCYSDALGQKGLAYYRLKNYNEAEKSYLEALGCNPDNINVMSNLGSLYFNQSRYIDAKDIYKKVLEKNPNHLDANYNYASTLGTLGDFNNAIFYFKKAISIRPSEPNYYRMVGLTYQNMGDKINANIYLQKAKQLQ